MTDRVLGDPLRLRQVLVNLLDNAIKFTEQGRVTLTLHTCPADGGMVPVRIAVRDTGAGIPEAQRSHIFQHFTQADSSTTRKHGGTGLGLAICSQLVDLMGGRLEVDSEVGHGSIFKVTLRLPTTDSECGVKDEAPTTPSQPAESLGRRVLLAEDNPVNQLVARSLLARLGCEVEVASNGEQALQMLDGARFDLVLMDCMMPGLDGYETTAEIRRRERAGARLPIVAMTASAMQGDRERCLAAGMDDYLSKPVTRDVLAGVLTRWAPEVARR